MDFSDVTTLFPQATDGMLEYHQGVITVWDTTNHLNEVRVNRTLIPQVPYIGPDDPNLDVGSLVALLRYDTVYIILGRIREI